MSVQDYGWLFTAIAIFGLMLNIGAVVYLFTKWSKHPRPTKWALAGIGLMIFGQIASRVSMSIFAQLFDADNFLLFNVLSSLGYMATHFAGLCMLIVAVYVDRVPLTDRLSGNLTEGRSDTSTLESNPYAV